MESVFWERFNSGMKYLCDRCNVVELRYDEYDTNRNARGIYCDECWCYIHLQTWTDEKGTHTIRSERIVLKIKLPNYL